MNNFQVLCYIKENHKIIDAVILYEGDYYDCLSFYGKNKSEYRKQNKYLSLIKIV